MAVPLTQLHPSPNNPRQNLTEIAELAQSIEENGLIQPIIVQDVPGQDGYQIVSGHRRYAACTRLKWAQIPCIVRRDMLPDEELVTMLVENGQRAGLDPVEEARALSMLKAGGHSDVDVGRRIGRSQGYVSRRLALLSLPVEEQEQLRAGLITIGAATLKAQIDSGRTRPRKKQLPVQYLSISHDLAPRVRSRCQRLGHKSKGAASVGGIACGECWESVIRADEREHLNKVSADRGSCALCDVEHQHKASA